LGNDGSTDSAGEAFEKERRCNARRDDTYANRRGRKARGRPVKLTKCPADRKKGSNLKGIELEGETCRGESLTETHSIPLGRKNELTILENPDRIVHPERIERDTRTGHSKGGLPSGG